MLIKQIKFTNFRNLNLSFEPTKEFNIILGENGKGKSNFLDGLYMISSGKSFKRFVNADNLNFNSNDDFAKVEVLLEANETVKLASVFTKLGENKFGHKYFINDKVAYKSKFEYILKTILFTPESLEILIGSPDKRREELDDLISIYNKEHSKLLTQYSYVMRSRNKLLVKINIGKASREQLSYWNDRLVNLGTEIFLNRLDYLEKIKPSLRKITKTLFEEFKSNELEIKYKTSLGDRTKDIKRYFLESLDTNFSKEVTLCRTLFGPHRDDIEFSIDNRNLHIFGSRGEQRLATMIFKIAAYDFLSEFYDTKIIFLLDDILSELDKSNKARLLDYIKRTKTQVFFTLANKDDLPKSLISEGFILDV